MDEIRQMIENGESETVEFKENFDKEAMETAVAFANTKGGLILIGVSDKGEIKGVQVGKSTLKKPTRLVEEKLRKMRIPYRSLKNWN